MFNEGRIVDASFVTVPHQRNTYEENQKIRGCGMTPVICEKGYRGRRRRTGGSSRCAAVWSMSSGSWDKACAAVWSGQSDWLVPRPT